MADEPGTATTFFRNHTAPYTHGISAPLFYILAEVLVSKTARRFMGSNMGWIELFQVHFLSLPYMGSLSGYYDPPLKHTAFSKKGAAGDEKYGYGDQLMDGAKGIPAVILAQIVRETFGKGFHFPRIPIKDLAVSAFCKTITRPLSVLLLAYLPADFQASYTVFESILARQATSSRLAPSEQKIKNTDHKIDDWIKDGTTAKADM